MRGLTYGALLLCLVALANGCASSSVTGRSSGQIDESYWVSMIEVIAYCHPHEEVM